MLGFYLGVKLFIIDYLFYRFPRVQLKHDTTARLWKALPTDAQLERKHNRAELDKVTTLFIFHFRFFNLNAESNDNFSLLGKKFLGKQLIINELLWNYQ